VLIWEQENGVFRDPARYPARSVACFGTHDTDPVAAWWEALPSWERDAVCRLDALAARGGSSLGARFTPAVHEALTALLLGSRSELVLLLAQDVLGVRDRVNVPATVGPHNWTWRLPNTIESLSADDAVRARLAMLRSEVERAGR
jgi:4-alpha-glucanotransferase